MALVCMPERGFAVPLEEKNEAARKVAFCYIQLRHQLLQEKVYTTIANCIKCTGKTFRSLDGLIKYMGAAGFPIHFQVDDLYDIPTNGKKYDIKLDRVYQAAMTELLAISLYDIERLTQLENYCLAVKERNFKDAASMLWYLYVLNSGACVHQLRILNEDLAPTETQIKNTKKIFVEGKCQACAKGSVQVLYKLPCKCPRRCSSCRKLHVLECSQCQSLLRRKCDRSCEVLPQPDKWCTPLKDNGQIGSSPSSVAKMKLFSALYR